MLRNEATDENVLAGEKTLIPGGVFPDDLDTTSLALKVLQPLNVSSVLDKMAEYVNEDGTFQVSHQVAGAARVTVMNGLLLNSITDVF
jgi:hypothetical protein